MFCPLFWKTFCHLDMVNSIETALQTCILRTGKKIFFFSFGHFDFFFKFVLLHSHENQSKFIGYCDVPAHERPALKMLRNSSACQASYKYAGCRATGLIHHRSAARPTTELAAEIHNTSWFSIHIFIACLSSIVLQNIKNVLESETPPPPIHIIS